MRLEDASRQPVATLTAAFALWKLLLFAIALGSAVGPAYDTSTTLLLPFGQGRFNDSPPSLVERLTRWDGIWYSGLSSEGYSYEQSWAFGTGLPTAVSLLVRALHVVGWGTSGYIEPLLAIVIANASHFASVLVLYRLGLALAGDSTLALAASLLHVISPAGLFLSAPYSESPCSLLSFVGYLFLAQAHREGAGGLAGDIYTTLSGLFFGLATTFRSNGILNGIPLAAEFVSLVPGIITSPTMKHVRRFVALGIAGILVALGSLGPHIVAYTIFCSEPSGIGARPWCRNLVPSIYTYVQEHYWGVGFMRYWTPNNTGLFFLAAPMIWVLLKSAVDMIRSPSATARNTNGSRGKSRELGRQRFLLQTMAASQLVLAALSVTHYHVQVITRLSSGYPVWYLWLAGCLRERSTAAMAQKIVMFLVMYCCIQGVLFACFLPPA